MEYYRSDGETSRGDSFVLLTPSPGYASCTATPSLWNMALDTRSNMYIDDGISIELDLRDRENPIRAEFGTISQGPAITRSYSRRKGRIGGPAGGRANFLGFSVKTDLTTVALPEPKRGAATVLSGELYACFSSRPMRIAMLHRVRGNAESFNSAKSIWGYCAGPIDDRLSYADGSGRWVVFPLAEVWREFLRSPCGRAGIRKDENISSSYS